MNLIRGVTGYLQPGLQKPRRGIVGPHADSIPANASNDQKR